MTVLKTQNLTKIYGGKPAVDDVSLTIEKGDIYGLIGQNGAGKTTLMRMITSLAAPDNGSIQLFGESDPAKINAARRRMSATIESPAMYPGLTAAQNLEFYRKQRGIPDKAVVNNALEFVGLTDTGNKKFKNFSMGMKQRLGLALTTLSNPDFVILDEPINGLDPMGIVEIRKLIQTMSEKGITILLSSHILTELSLVATKYAFLHHGKLIKNLTHEQLQEECKRALSLVVNDAQKACVVLETTLGIHNYKQVNNNEIRLYEQFDKSEEISYQLIHGGVRLAAMQEVGDTLEDYYKNVIGGSYNV
ncbi:MAG: ATP-binding cassette domain-containing protein [Defluviitaleaceae bacterium]|nr:ATP-binding cassette domain-containing protein [Defluviitaleaceae bacterium]